jgi:hypothetical protein
LHLVRYVFPDKISCVTLHLVRYILEYFYDAQTHELKISDSNRVNFILLILKSVEYQKRRTEFSEVERVKVMDLPCIEE